MAFWDKPLAWIKKKAKEAIGAVGSAVARIAPRAVQAALPAAVPAVGLAGLADKLRKEVPNKLNLGIGQNSVAMPTPTPTRVEPRYETPLPVSDAPVDPLDAYKPGGFIRGKFRYAPPVRMPSQLPPLRDGGDGPVRNWRSVEPNMPNVMSREQFEEITRRRIQAGLSVPPNPWEES